MNEPLVGLRTQQLLLPVSDTAVGMTSGKTSPLAVLYVPGASRIVNVVPAGIDVALATTVSAFVIVLYGLLLVALPVVSLPVTGFTSNCVCGVGVGGAGLLLPRRVQPAVLQRLAATIAATTKKNERVSHELQNAH